MKEVRTMTDEEKARIILKQLDHYVQVNWNWERAYLKGIKEGLKKIKEKESNAATSDSDEKHPN